MKRYIAVFGALAVALGLLVVALLVYGRVYETVIGCVCCGVILYTAGISGWVTWEAWREERRKR